MAEYKFSSEISSISKVEELIVSFVNDNNLCTTLQGRIVVSSIEAISNSIVHGNKKDLSKKVKFVLEKEHARIVVMVEDEGKGFDYDNLPDPTLPENLLNLSGRGVFLMRKLSDSVVFNDKGNRVELYFKL